MNTLLLTPGRDGEQAYANVRRFPTRPGMDAYEVGQCVRYLTCVCVYACMCFG